MQAVALRSCDASLFVANKPQTQESKRKRKHEQRKTKNNPFGSKKKSVWLLLRIAMKMCCLQCGKGGRKRMRPRIESPPPELKITWNFHGTYRGTL